MGHIFISYSRTDTEYARRLADVLQSKGLDVWIDARLDYGSQWPLELQKQLDSCEAFIVIMTPRSFSSEWVQSELQRARRKLKPIFPLLLEGDEPWLSVESTQFYDVRGGMLPDARFYSALQRVNSASGTASTSQNSQTVGGRKDYRSFVLLEAWRGNSDRGNHSCGGCFCRMCHLCSRTFAGKIVEHFIEINARTIDA